MTRSITGTIHLKESDGRWKLHKIITCSVCGAQSYVRRTNRINKVLETPCKKCRGRRASAIRERDRIQYQQDLSLLQAHTAARRLVERIDERVKHDCCWHKKTYQAWLNMIDRCFNPDNSSFSDYGGRGISVCDHWLDSPEWFFIELGLAPDGLSLDRIDNNKDYSPDNCRWATDYTQSNNRRHYKDHQVRSSSWWRAFGLMTNPYIYGPMPWKRSNLKYRKQEAVERGWYKSPRIKVKSTFHK